MKKIIAFIITCILIMSIAGISFSQVDSLVFTKEEEAYLNLHKNQVYKVGLDPLSGMDYFKTNDGKELGVVLEVLKMIEVDTGLKFELVTDQTWNQVYEGLHTGSVDILFGANETEERLETMAFTLPLYQHPYAIFTLQNNDMFTIGDLDNLEVGFMEGDFVIKELATKYTHLTYEKKYYGDQKDIFDGLLKKEIQAAVFSGGSIIYQFLFEHPELKYVAPIESIVSDLTFSVRKDNQLLWGILNKEINHLKSTGEIEAGIEKTEVSFIREIINLTPAERRWLQSKRVINVGVTKDYLPIDYYDGKSYQGVSGTVFSEIARITGMNVNWIYSDFNTLHAALEDGGVDVLNIVRTEEREAYLDFTDPYSYERDIIVGLKTAEEVLDVYGLEGKRVAVVDGFWHEDYLKKNLVSVEIVPTLDIVESMEVVLKGDADYFIENPTVVKFYVAVNDFYDLVEKGVTSSDSYLYYGITKRHPELTQIINKVLPIIDLKTLNKTGYQSVPLVTKKRTELRLVLIIIALMTALTAIGFRLKRVVNELISSQATTELLKQRQILEYTDVMTGLKNRNYFYKEVEPKEASYNRNLAVIMCDIDRLKYVNDTYGHPTGDALIVKVAQILQQSVETITTPIRMGGDEFLVILPEYDEEKCEQLVNRIQEESERVEIKTDGDIVINITLSLGYAIKQSNEMLEHVIMRADNEMYMNKKRRWSM